MHLDALSSGLGSRANGAPMGQNVGLGKQVLLVIDRTPTGLHQTILEPVQFVPLKSGVA